MTDQSAHLVNDNFRNLARVLERFSIGHVDKMLFDLGWSGYQSVAPRGFSFQNDEPLLMNYSEDGATQRRNCKWSFQKKNLPILFSRTARNDSARGIARAIVEARSKERILTTGRARQTRYSPARPIGITSGKSIRRQKHFKRFALRVNDELERACAKGLSRRSKLSPRTGRLAVISFHSIEDRIVKNILRDAATSKSGKQNYRKNWSSPTRSEVT